MAAPKFGRLQWIELAVVASLTLAAVWFFFLRTDDASRVRARLREAVEFAEKQPKGSGFNLQNVGASHAVGDFFTEKTDVEISGESRGDVYTLAAESRAEIDVTFADDSHKTAAVKCSAMATGMTVNGDHYREGRLISAEMVLDDGEWRFRSLRADPVVSFH